jgi:hypothetical protein
LTKGGYEGAFGVMGNDLKVDSGDGCTLYICYKITEWINFINCKLYINKAVSKRYGRSLN